MAIIIPSTGRAEQCARLVERIHQTVRARPVSILVSVEPHDVEPYGAALAALTVPGQFWSMGGLTWDDDATGPGSHVAAINRAARDIVSPGWDGPKIIIKLDDDHWPVTHGWDVLYLNALTELDGTGVVYGNDLFQGERLPTVPGISADIVRRLGWYAPPELGHWHCDDFWRELGARAGRLRYLPDVIIEHRNVQAGKAPDDPTYALGGLNRDRIDADGRVWAKMISRPVTGGGRLDNVEPEVKSWPSQMDIWADRVIGLAARKGWKP